MLQRLRDSRDLFSSVCILTKSPGVLLDDPEYVACLKGTGVEVQVSIAFWRDSQSQMLEPGAPPVSTRRQAVERLIEQGIDVALRVDPLFPRGVAGCVEYQSQEEDIAPLIQWAAAVGVLYVIASPLKQVYRRNRVQEFYDSLLPAFQTVRGAYRRMPEDLQHRLMSEMHEVCANNGLRLEHCFCNILKRNAGVPASYPSAEGKGNDPRPSR
ncbi:MAG: hypothetical protein A3K18_29225 [Lentisphaerae bacterium RIFOXYA12_64_32]|nr:MAG: hypothetical protein A3K18_29225 [Lentisphaerae bacterium RIFOXYA12_64_32]